MPCWWQPAGRSCTAGIDDVPWPMRGTVAITVTSNITSELEVRFDILNIRCVVQFQ